MSAAQWIRALAGLAGLVACATACDPVHSNEVDALGGEAANVHEGPTHRPGQPCLLCHDGKIGDPEQFSVAGTVFVNPDNPVPTNGAQGATVILTDATNATFTAQTNEVGNFYITPNQFTPSYPMRVTVTYEGAQTQMRTHVGRDGACAGCHFSPRGFDSPGPVAITWPDGGVP